MKPTTTLILGGGFGGLATAWTLRSLIPADHKIAVFDKSDSFSVGAAKTWVMVGDKSRDEVSRTRKNLLPQNVEFVEAEIEGMNLALGEVHTRQGVRKGDFMVIALGADVKMSAIPGLQENAQTFYTLDGATRLRGTLADFQGGDVVFLIPRTPFKCPPAPYEAAMVLESSFRKRGLKGKSRISIVTVEPMPMSTAGPEMGSFVRKLIEQRGIAYQTLRKTVRIDGPNRKILFEQGDPVSYDLLIAVPPHESPHAVRDAGLTNESGWVPVNPETMVVSQGQSSIPVYAVGDITSVQLPGKFNPEVSLVLPKAGVFAASQGGIAARQIAGRINDKPVSDVFDGKGFCYLEVGDDEAVKGEGSFFELPHPMMSRHEADQAQYKDKVRWVDQWLAGSFPELLAKEKK